MRYCVGRCLHPTWLNYKWCKLWCSPFPQGDPNVPAGQLTLDVDLSRPVVLPDLEHQRSIEELSRLVMSVHEEVQRDAQRQDQGSPPTSQAAADETSGVGTGAEGMEAASGTYSESYQPGPSSSSHPSDAQPFILPLGVMARNEVYPRTCKKWWVTSAKCNYIQHQKRKTPVFSYLLSLSFIQEYAITVLTVVLHSDWVTTAATDHIIAAFAVIAVCFNSPVVL